MPIPFETANRIYTSEKHLLKPMQWRLVVENRKKVNSARQALECRIQIDSSIPRGVWFRITIFPASFSCICFQLECDLPDGARTHVPLYRLELHPIRAHLNKPYGGDEVNGLLIDAGQTHEHSFYDSLNTDWSLRTSACEQARVVVNPPTDFDAGLSYVCAKLNIENNLVVPRPENQGDLL